MDATTGKILAESNSNSQIEPASMTKVMTGYIVADQIEQDMISNDDNVLISRKAWKMEGSRMFIEVGKRVSVEDLLKGLVIQSGNDAAVALAEYVAGSEQIFVDVMNEYASVLGLRNTLFQNSTGLPDADHFTSVRDLAVLSRALIDEFPSHYDLYKEKEFTFNNIRQLNRNKLLWRDESVDGMKTGHTEAAGYCLIASAKRNDMRLVTVVAGSKSDKERFDASQRLLEYGFRFYAAQKLLEGNEELKSSTVWGGKKESVSIGLENDLLVTLPRGDFRNLTINYTIQNNIQAPIKAGDELGLVEVISNNNIVVSESLIALEDIDEKGFFGRMIAKIILWFIGLFNFNE
jgi:D-alanyl-D-alanine carboxypeptidase (penicillin-binding protein 5/6)